MEQYFAFHKLQEYMEIFDAIWIFLAVIFTVYVLSSLYYWTWKDQYITVPERTEATKWVSNTITITTTPYTTPDLSKQLERVEQEMKQENKTVKRKRSSKKVRHSDAPKKKDPLT